MLGMHTDEHKRRHGEPEGSGHTSHMPQAVEPLTLEALSKRRSLVIFRRRLRRLERPAFVNTDASWCDGRAGVAYDSAALGRRVEFVSCGSNSSAEYLALMMAMGDAARCLVGLVCFRLDSTTVVNLQGRTPELVEPRDAIEAMLARRPEWLLELVTRKRNNVANGLARRPFLYPDRNDWLRSSSELRKRTRRPYRSQTIGLNMTMEKNNEPTSK